MREILQQLRRLSDDGQVKITITHGDKGRNADEHLLALQRAYNIKKILAAHMFDLDGIIVEARGAKGSEQANAMVLTVQTDAANFKDQIEVISDPQLRFAGKSEQITPEIKAALDRLVAKLKSMPTASVDIVVYSNDHSHPTADKTLALTRANAIKNELSRLGVGNSFAVIGWGDFDNSIDLYSAMEDATGANRTEFVIRTPETEKP